MRCSLLLLLVFGWSVRGAENLLLAPRPNNLLVADAPLARPEPPSPRAVAPVEPPPRPRMTTTYYYYTSQPRQAVYRGRVIRSSGGC